MITQFFPNILACVKVKHIFERYKALKEVMILNIKTQSKTLQFKFSATYSFFIYKFSSVLVTVMSSNSSSRQAEASHYHGYACCYSSG